MGTVKPIRWAILGCWDIAGSTFAPCLLRSPLCELVAVCRRDGEKGDQATAHLSLRKKHTLHAPGLLSLSYARQP